MKIKWDYVEKVHGPGPRKCKVLINAVLQMEKYRHLHLMLVSVAWSFQTHFMEIQNLLKLHDLFLFYTIYNHKN